MVLPSHLIRHYLLPSDEVYVRKLIAKLMIFFDKARNRLAFQTEPFDFSVLCQMVR